MLVRGMENAGLCWSHLHGSTAPCSQTAVPMGCCSSRRVCFPTKCFNLSRDRGKAGGVWCAHGLPPCFTSWPREEESDSFVLCVNLCVTVLVRKRDCRNGFRSNRAAVPAIVPYWGNPVVIWQLFVCRIWGAGISMPPMTPQVKAGGRRVAKARSANPMGRASGCRAHLLPVPWGAWHCWSHAGSMLLLAARLPWGRCSFGTAVQGRPSAHILQHHPRSAQHDCSPSGSVTSHYFHRLPLAVVPASVIWGVLDLSGRGRRVQ